MGCGAGGLHALLKRSRVQLAGAGISPGMIVEATRRLGKSADLWVGDSEKLPWKAGTFDLVVTTDSFHHWTHPQKSFSEMRRVLRKGGHIVVADVSAPPVLRRVSNWIARFGRGGDVRVYSAQDLGDERLGWVWLIEIDGGFVEHLVLVARYPRGGELPP